MSDTRGRGRTSSDAGKPMNGIYDFSYGTYALDDGDVRRLPLRLTGEPRMLLPAEVERLLRATWFAFPGYTVVPEVLAVFRVSPDSYSARGLRDTAVQRRLVFDILDLLASDGFADVARAFRACALLPEGRFRVLGWLLTSPAHRGYLTPRLVGRVLLRGTWRVLKPYVPGWVWPVALQMVYGLARARAGRGTRG